MAMHPDDTPGVCSCLYLPLHVSLFTQFPFVHPHVACSMTRLTLICPWPRHFLWLLISFS